MLISFNVRKKEEDCGKLMDNVKFSRFIMDNIQI